MNIYETDPLLDQYLLFHYGKPEEILPWPGGPREALDFPVRTAKLLQSALGEKSQPLSAFDIGCAVGRSAFELARFCDRVLAIDYSQRFVDAAEKIRVDGSLPYRIAEEGDITTAAVAERPAGVVPDSIVFKTADACALPPELPEFDLVHAANLIDRLAEPSKFLNRLPGLVRQGGLLLLTSPYTWMENFTPRENWVGGYGERRTLEGLREALAPAFALEHRSDEPFLIREHARKYQWSMAQASIWRLL